jgi:hypothetical protein
MKLRSSSHSITDRIFHIKEEELQHLIFSAAEAEPKLCTAIKYISSPTNDQNCGAINSHVQFALSRHNETN